MEKPTIIVPSGVPEEYGDSFGKVAEYLQLLQNQLAIVNRAQNETYTQREEREKSEKKKGGKTSLGSMDIIPIKRNIAQVRGLLTMQVCRAGGKLALQKREFHFEDADQTSDQRILLICRDMLRAALQKEPNGNFVIVVSKKNVPVLRIAKDVSNSVRAVLAPPPSQPAADKPPRIAPPAESRVEVKTERRPVGRPKGSTKSPPKRDIFSLVPRETILVEERQVTDGPTLTSLTTLPLEEEAGDAPNTVVIASGMVTIAAAPGVEIADVPLMPFVPAVVKLPELIDERPVEVAAVKTMTLPPATMPSAKNVSSDSDDQGFNFESMKEFSTSVTYVNIRGVFEACEIRTKRDLLGLLGTIKPTQADWKNFIKYLRIKAQSKGVNFWQRSAETLYWWLSKKKYWIEPCPLSEPTTSEDETGLRVPSAKMLATAIDFESMKEFPTDFVYGNILRAFGFCGIFTNGDLLTRLGSVEPTAEAWDNFFENVRSTAAANGLKLFPSANEKLYKWLAIKKRWIRPIAGR